MANEVDSRKMVAVFSPQLNPVGTERVMYSLAQGINKHDYRVDLLRIGTEWRDKEPLPTGLRILEFLPLWMIKSLPRHGKLFRVSMALLMLMILPKLVSYLRKEKPDVLMPGLVPAVALLANLLAHSGTRVVVSIQGWPTETSVRGRLWRFLYRQADGVVAPTEGVAEAVANIAGIRQDLVSLIPNPVIDDSIYQRAKEPVDHPDFQGGQPPVILGVGRLTAQKDFGTLLRAFATVRERMDARLTILGEGEDRPALTNLIDELGLKDYVDMPGYVENPFSFMARADLFVLSSRWEGPGHVLIEALAVGASVVSTDCPSGPRGILLDGAAGALTPVEDANALAQAIVDALSNPEEAKRKAEFGRSTISRYHEDNVVESYVRLIQGVLAPSEPEELAQAST